MQGRMKTFGLTWSVIICVTINVYHVCGASFDGDQDPEQLNSQNGGSCDGVEDDPEFCEKQPNNIEGGHDETLKLTTGSNLVKLDGISVGHSEELVLRSGQVLHLNTASLKPLIIEIPNFLSTEECSHFINLAQAHGLRESETVNADAIQKAIKLRDVDQDKRLSVDEMMLTIEDSYDMYLTEDDILEMYRQLNLDLNGDDYISPEEINRIQASDLTNYLLQLIKNNPVKKSRHSKQVWLFPDSSKDKIFQNLQDRVQEVTRLPSVMITKSDFQIVTYGVEGHYNAHQDSNPKTKIPCCTRSSAKNTRCRICRLMTILFYLNEVEVGGGTAFPLAGNDTYDEHKFRQSHHVNLQRYCDTSPLVVKPEHGKAVLWYNHYIDEETGWVGELDEYTWHGGCPVLKGEKWIANFWIKFDTDRETYLHDEL